MPYSIIHSLAFSVTTQTTHHSPHTTTIIIIIIIIIFCTSFIVTIHHISSPHYAPPPSLTTNNTPFITHHHHYILHYTLSNITTIHHSTLHITTYLTTIHHSPHTLIIFQPRMRVSFPLSHSHTNVKLTLGEVRLYFSSVLHMCIGGAGVGMVCVHLFSFVS